MVFAPPARRHPARRRATASSARDGEGARPAAGHGRSRRQCRRRTTIRDRPRPHPAPEAARGLGDDASPRPLPGSDPRDPARTNRSKMRSRSPFGDPVAAVVDVDRDRGRGPAATVTAAAPPACRSALSKRLTSARRAAACRPGRSGRRPAAVAVSSIRAGSAGSRSETSRTSSAASTSVRTWLRTPASRRPSSRRSSRVCWNRSSSTVTRSRARWVRGGQVVAAPLHHLDAGDEGRERRAQLVTRGRRRTGRRAGSARRGPRPCC